MRKLILKSLPIITLRNGKFFFEYIVKINATEVQILKKKKIVGIHYYCRPINKC